MIEGNTFETFDAPIVYAKSIDGLTFRNNKIITTDAFEPFHWNTHRFMFERVVNAVIENNEFDNGYDPARDLLQK